MMPRMTGEEMVDQIRRHRDFDDVPILLLTAKADENLRVQLLNKGVQDALVKPFLAKELLARASGLVTRKRTAEAALRESHALLKAVTEGITDSIFIKDAQGRYQMVNRAGAERLGKQVDEILGQVDAALFDAAEAADIQAQDQKVMTDVQVLTFEETRGVAGRARTYLTTKAPHRDATGRIVGVLGISYDITDRKLAEEELQRAEDHLEIRVQERTEELSRALHELEAETEERLRAVEELRIHEHMLMQQSRLAAMGEMLVNIFHQWRQPLNVVGLLLQGLVLSYDRGVLIRNRLLSVFD